MSLVAEYIEKNPEYSKAVVENCLKLVEKCETKAVKDVEFSLYCGKIIDKMVCSDNVNVKKLVTEGGPVYEFCLAREIEPLAYAYLLQWHKVAHIDGCFDGKVTALVKSGLLDSKIAKDISSFYSRNKTENAPTVDGQVAKVLNFLSDIKPANRAEKLEAKRQAIAIIGEIKSELVEQRIDKKVEKVQRAETKKIEAIQELKTPETAEMIDKIVEKAKEQTAKEIEAIKTAPTATKVSKKTVAIPMELHDKALATTGKAKFVDALTELLAIY